MNKYQLSNEDLRAHLKEQISFLYLSSLAYDRGFFSEGKRLAVTLRIMLHDTSNSTSLLTLLNKKNILFYDTALEFNPNNMLPTLGLVMVELSTGGASGFRPPLDSTYRSQRGKIPFEPWWNEIVIASGCTDPNPFRITRKDLVLTIANKDGGAHIDKKLDDIYAKITRSPYLYVFKSTGKVDLQSPELPSIRQIAYEVLKSLKDEFPEIFRELRIDLK